MLSYKELSPYPARFLAMTGYTGEEFQALLPYFQARFETYIKTTRLDGKPRTQRQYCFYRNSPLPTIEDKQLFILVYLKQGTTQDVHAALFNMCQPKANVWIHLLHPILNQALADAGVLPAREPEALRLTQEQDVAVYFHDGTERPIPRPKD